MDVTSKIGHSPLHLACRFGHLPVVLLLLAEGAELNARDADGNSPLHKVWREQRPGHESATTFVERPLGRKQTRTFGDFR